MIERRKLQLAWSSDDEKNVESFKLKNLRFLSLKRGKSNAGKRENIFEKFCNIKGLNDNIKEDWLMHVENDIELKEEKLRVIVMKKKLAKSRKRKIEIFIECRETLFEIVESWDDTPGMEEDRMFVEMKMIVKKERMKKCLQGAKMNRMNKIDIENVKTCAEDAVNNSSATKQHAGDVIQCVGDARQHAGDARQHAGDAR